MQDFNLIFYTYFYGSDQNPAFQIPAVPSLKYKCYYYTNNKTIFEQLKATKWIGIYDDKPTTDDLIESCMAGKHIKTMPHEYAELNRCDYLCFLDTKVDKVSESFVENFIKKYFIEQKYALLLRKHWFIQNSVWNEYKESMIYEKYKMESEKYKKYITNQLENGLCERVEHHCACGFLIRNMKHPKTVEINSTWYTHIQECGIQDQLSFFFVKQLFNDYIRPFSEIPYECAQPCLSEVYSKKNNEDKRHMELKEQESSLEAQYNLKSTTPSDINEHLPTLRALASECRHVTEAGVRTVVSSYAFATALKGKAEHALVQVDLKKSANVTTFQAECAAEGVHTVFYEESDLTCPVAETDLLFIDTWHIYGHLKRELARWHSYAKTYIVLHDTTVDEWAGETIRNGWDAVAQSKESGIPVEEIRKGLWPAVEEFLKEHPEWHLAKRYTNNNGLTILKRRTAVSEYKSANRPPVLTQAYPYVGPFVDFLLSDESPVREFPVHICSTEPTQSVILYNTEQLSRSQVRTDLVRVASNPYVKAVWDYSAENCRILKENGIHAIHVPLVSPTIYVNRLKAMRASTPVYDIGFCGTSSSRRQVILQGLRDAGLSVLSVTDFGEERDRKLAMCRVLLNVHFADDYRIFEQARCDAWLRAGVPVVSETSLDDDPRCINSPYSTLVETTKKTVNALRERPPANDSLVLLLFLKGSANATLSTQTVDESRIHLVIATKEPVPVDGGGYASVRTYSGDLPHEYAMDFALQKGSHLCVMEGRHKLEPHVLQMLLDSKDKGVIAPMLVSNTRYSNYHAKVDANGYCLDDPLYDDLLYKRVKGQIAVPVVNGIYFVNHALLPKLKYSDGTRRDSYVIMCDALRKQGIPQYLDNRQFHGTIQ